MKRFFNYIKFDINKNWFANLLFLLSIFILFNILIINISNVDFNLNVKNKKNKYSDNIVVTNYDNENYFNEYEKIGWSYGDIYFKEQDIKQKYSRSITCRNNFMFRRFNIPLVKGRLPEAEGEAIVSYCFKDIFKLGDILEIEDVQDYKIKIVGYKYGDDMDMSAMYPQNSYGGVSYLEFLSFDESKWKNYSTYQYIYKVPLNIQQQAKENNYKFNNVPDIIDCYYKSGDDSSFGIFILTTIGITFFFIFILTRSITKTKDNQLNSGLCFLYGQPKLNLILLKLLKDIFCLLLTAGGAIFVILNYAKKHTFLMSWKGYEISFVILITIFITYAISDYIKLKKFNFSEILNFREN